MKKKEKKIQVKRKSFRKRFIFMLVCGLLLNYFTGLAVMYLAHIKVHQFDSFVIVKENFIQEPKTQFEVMIRGHNLGNPIYADFLTIYHDWKFQLFFLALYGVLIYRIIPKKQTLDKMDAADYGVHGTAKWGTDEDIEKYLQQTHVGFILGEHNNKLVVHPANDPNLQLNQIIIAFGGAGSGKSSGFIITNILHNIDHVGESMIITDPKGELYNKTSQYARANGYDVWIVNLLNMKKSMRQNPLSYIETVEDAMNISNMIIENTDGGNGGGDSMWRNAEMSYFSALIMYIKETQSHDKLTLQNVLKLGTLIGKDEELLERMFGSLAPDSEARTVYRIFALSEEKTRAGILIGFGARLKLWASNNVAYLTNASDFDLNDLGRKKVLLYILTPDSDKTFDLIPGLLIDQAFKVLYAQAGENENEKLLIPVRVKGDEMANIAAIPDLERKVSTMRSRGISIVPIFQNLTQFQNRYDHGRWSEILGSSDTIVFLGSNDQETNEYFSKKIGKTTILVNNVSESETSERETLGKSHTAIGRQLVFADELTKILNGRALILQKGRDPIIIDKHFYFKQSKWSNIEQTHWKMIEDRVDKPIPFIELPSYVAEVAAGSEMLEDEASYVEEEMSLDETMIDDPGEFLDDEADKDLSPTDDNEQEKQTSTRANDNYVSSLFEED